MGKSGGYYWETRKGKYHVQLQRNCKKHSYGYAYTEDEAKLKAEAARISFDIFPRILHCFPSDMEVSMGQGQQPSTENKKRLCTNPKCRKPTNNYRCSECWEQMRQQGEISDNSGYDPGSAGNHAHNMGLGLTYTL